MKITKVDTRYIRLDEVEPTTITHDMTLQRSIALIGQQVPVILSEAIEADTKKIVYRIHAGQRRISALRELNEELVMARVYQPDIVELHHDPEYKADFDHLMAKIAASENLVRSPNAGAEADALWSLLDERLRGEVGLGDLRDAINEITAQTGINRTTIKALIELRSHLCDRGVEMLREGVIATSTAKQLRRLTRTEQTELIEQCEGAAPKLKDIQAAIRAKRCAEQTEMFSDLPELPTAVDPHAALITGIGELLIGTIGLDDMSIQILHRAVEVIASIDASQRVA